MGFNKRFISLESTIKSLKNENLREYYGKSDVLIFEDQLSSKIYNLYNEGKTEKEIILLLNLNMEEKTNEMY